ncbi:WD repeat-containing protein 75-like [Pyrus ussuriensis x Pyrus communis]|uniref:WD repeat-containing protein 75-like n=1 Tax=Pyrus ussuriensis x Pyrus communis TaxID=2448454 RepID=A0A5N5GY72_9ROSA|nr:WD repeat-containing protein 75-like [Pyrus ussuriensis x Pyrus communis]KAB2620569.1 WD repeat-containing protein 75-like [Pyrus ussuriensis x Pyrus communis]
MGLQRPTLCIIIMLRLQLPLSSSTYLQPIAIKLFFSDRRVLLKAVKHSAGKMHPQVCH